MSEFQNRPSVLSNAVAEKEVSKQNKILSKSPDLPISHNEKPKTSSGRSNKIDVERIELDRQQEEIIKKVAAFKPLINSASANVDLANDGSRKNEKSERKNGSTKMETKEKPREEKGDKKRVKSSMVDLNDTEVSPTDKVLANRSNAPSKNALNFNVLQQQQQQQSSSKNSSSKSPTRKIP
ncbi:unnamed protein product [Bursaphelenchus xylophilus]|uniref:(pine wood nematode) hypothetical protein n=1 Tax=Bursaphelenchus xylophilus TaxID=6326 RepID=A0A1I7RX20_BURXY|nr:unnamed protein product [Bursaphelenchus xylophilus]CAG9121272.1 unnamed protein product [Bursaphelenchus xylophilus]